MSHAHELIKSVYTWAKKTIEADPAGKEEVQPTAFFRHADGRDGMMPAHWTKDYEKDVFLAFIRRQLEAPDIVGYALVSEAWMGKRLDIMPRNDPERIEVLNISAQNRGEKGMIIQATITRQESGRRLVDPYTIFDGEIAGRMANLFDPISPIH